jgi:hypothetical protein
MDGKHERLDTCYAGDWSQRQVIYSTNPVIHVRVIKRAAYLCFFSALIGVQLISAQEKKSHPFVPGTCSVPMTLCDCR